MALTNKDGLTRWLEEVAPAAVAGHGGHKTTFSVACVLWRMLREEQAVWARLKQYNATKCAPPWSERELRHKLVSAEKATAEERRARPKHAAQGGRKSHGSNMAEIRAALAAPPKRYSTGPSSGSGPQPRCCRRAQGGQ